MKRVVRAEFVDPTLTAWPLRTATVPVYHDGSHPKAISLHGYGVYVLRSVALAHSRYLVYEKVEVLDVDNSEGVGQ